MIQNEQIHLLLNYQVPNNANLKEKYTVLYPTEYIDIDKANKFIDIIVQGFDKWNSNIDDYVAWLDNGYTSDAISYGLSGQQRTLEQYIDEMKTLTSEKTIKKLYFDNILIRDNWAALHYRYRSEDSTTHEKYVGDRMQFLKFKEEGSNFKIEASWIK